MSHFRSILLFISLLVSPSFFAQTDSCSVLQRLVANQSIQREFASFIFINPATHIDAYQHELTQLSISLVNLKMDRPVLQQEGRGYNNKQFDASSFMKLTPNSRVWGGVNYTNGIKRGMRWNESADYALVYPYVMGDSVGGNLSTEEYSFLGGYARRYKRMGWGIESAYRALLEYRNIDPRPRNIASELKVKLGIDYSLNTNYQLGAMFLFNKYKQTNDVQFFSELGKSRVYHFVGLGMDYDRFLGTNTSAYYNGNTYGGGFQLSPVNKRSGIYASAAYSNFSFEKILSSLNELPLAQLTEHSFLSQVAYRISNSCADWGVKATIEYKNRLGTENLFGDPTATIYPQIGSVEQFIDKDLKTSLSFYYVTPLRSSTKLTLMPSFVYSDKKVNYKFPKLWLSRSSVQANLLTEFSSRFKKSFLRLLFEGCYHNILWSEINIMNLDKRKLAVRDMMISNWEGFSSNNYQISFQPRYDLLLSDSKAIFVSGKWQYNKYHRIQSFNNFELGCGIVF